MKKIETIPITRVKKIMQQDEEIGKISVDTPFLVSRATELFIKSMVKNASDVCLERKSSKITEIDLKQIIDKTDKYDFLRSIVENIGQGKKHV